ncbi:MAG: hypothetical protein KDH96_09955, partial [Candidatus Riesia sp.]|nr:hypothetical protein [Candidatus Riesia sp.]
WNIDHNKPIDIYEADRYMTLNPNKAFYIPKDRLYELISNKYCNKQCIIFEYVSLDYQTIVFENKDLINHV